VNRLLVRSWPGGEGDWWGKSIH